MSFGRMALGFAGLVLLALAVGGIATATVGHKITPPDTPETRALQTGPSGLPLPRFVSLKSSPVNVRSGPGRDHDIAWQFTLPGWPVEITAEFDNWRRIRDSEGAEGWVFHALLTGERTALVLPWSEDGTATLHRGPEATSDAVAYLESGVLISIDTCESGWCSVRVNRHRGFVDQGLLWGVYPDERVD
ncbi:MAG: SH3 domain-containing protein [Pseudomonadota bacterium]